MAGRGARLKRQLARRGTQISEAGLQELIANRDRAQAELVRELYYEIQYNPKKCTGLRVRVAMLTAKIEEMQALQHMNPPPMFPAAARDDEAAKLEQQLAELATRRAAILRQIEILHAQMTHHVHIRVRAFEQDMWANDPTVKADMEQLDHLRGLNTPLRTQVWDLQAKIKELSSGHDESCSSNVGCNCGPMPDQPGMRAAHLDRMLKKEQDKESDPFHVGGCV